MHEIQCDMVMLHIFLYILNSEYIILSSGTIFPEILLGIFQPLEFCNKSFLLGLRNPAKILTQTVLKVLTIFTYFCSITFVELYCV